MTATGHETAGQKHGGKPRLLASYVTLAGSFDPLNGVLVSPWSLSDRIATAAEVGYTGFGFGEVDLLHWLPREGGFANLRRVLADNGIEQVEVEVLTDWFADGERKARSDLSRRALLEAAAELGARHVKVLADMAGHVWPHERMVESFASLCAEAATVGTRICVELFPTANLATIASGNAMVQAAGAANGGLLVDIWHLTRSGGSYDDILSIAPGKLVHVELNDAAAVQVGSVMEDTVRRRRYPGDGDFDIPLFLRRVSEQGYDGWYGVEIISDEIRASPLRTAAERSFNAAARFLS